MENVKVHSRHWRSFPAALLHALEAVNVDIVGDVIDVENQLVQALDELLATISLRRLGRCGVAVLLIRAVPRGVPRLVALEAKALTLIEPRLWAIARGMVLGPAIPARLLLVRVALLLCEPRCLSSSVVLASSWLT